MRLELKYRAKQQEKRNKMHEKGEGWEFLNELERPVMRVYDYYIVTGRQIITLSYLIFCFLLIVFICIVYQFYCIDSLKFGRNSYPF